ncbi:hypothetical protein JNK13_02400 [bacterium]|nr:hypothetical protein [bacterium]
MITTFGTIAWWEIFCAGLCTLAIFSFLYRENIFYRSFEHFFLGIATAIGIVASIRYFLWPEVLKPLFGLDLPVFPDGTSPTTYPTARLLLLIPIAFGSLYYFILSQRYAWLAQLVIGFSLGVGGGLAFEATFNELLPQIIDSFRPLYPTSECTSMLKCQVLSNWVFMLTLISALTYFFFTFKRKAGSVESGISVLGRQIMMICFGAFFGSTIMARMALLVERMEFLINQWIPIFFN